MKDSINNNSTPDYKPTASNTESPSVSAQPAQEAAVTKESAVHARRYGKTDEIIIALCMAGIITSGILDIVWLRWVLIGFCLLTLPSPVILQKVKERRRLSIMSIYGYFKRMGLNPVMNGDEIRWESQGKMNTMRLANGCQLQVYREYPLQEEILGKFESAASVTMHEVFSAKVGVHRPDGEKGSIFFSTELFCTSIRELGMILPASVGILDTAEERQRLNLGEIISAESKPKRRIGFVQGNL